MHLTSLLTTVDLRGSNRTPLGSEHPKQYDDPCCEASGMKETAWEVATPAMCVRREASHSDADVTAVLGPGVKRHVTCPARGGGGQSAILGDVTARSGLGGSGTELV